MANLISKQLALECERVCEEAEKLKEEVERATGEKIVRHTVLWDEATQSFQSFPTDRTLQ